MKKILFAIYLVALSASAVAGPGHDHGDEAPLVESEASPRVVMESDLFEAVAILKGQTFEIFVDHAATNAPVENAELAILLNGESVPLELHNVGEFDAMLPNSMVGKNIDLAMRITVGDQSDVLTGQLVLDDHDHDHADDEHAHLFEYTAMAGAVFLALVLIALFVKRRNKGVN
jgi:hypothetical protein